MRKNILLILLCLLCLASLAACGNGSSAQKPPTSIATPKVNLGEQIVMTSARTLNAAQTLHSRLSITISGPDANGGIESELWNAKPALSRTVILQSTLPNVAETGMITVDNGKQIWQYEPAQKVVYTGTVTTNNSRTSSTAEQALFFSDILQTLLTHSNAELVSSSASINGHSANKVHIVPQDQATASRFDYDGYLYIDKTTQLPLAAALSVQTVGKLTLEITQLDLNPSIPASTFTFAIPDGIKVLPLQQASTTGGTLTLAQAQQQAGYHLLSITNSQSGYTLQSIDALGAPGNQIYSLHYTRGALNFTIAEGKALANLPASGQNLSVRGTNATLATDNGATTLSWTEKGIGIQITGQGLSRTQVVAIAQMLA